MRFHRALKAAALLMVLSLSGVLHAQFQTPNNEELKMTSDPKAPGAAAEYLDIEDTTDDSLHSRIYYARIKILQDSGKNAADVELPALWNMDKGDDFAVEQQAYQGGSGLMLLFQPSIDSTNRPMITDFKARVIHPDGTVVPFEGKAADLVEVQKSASKNHPPVIHVGGAEAGSIVEYRYVERYEGFYSSPTWDVQRNFYVRKAHFSFLPFKSFLSGIEHSTGSYLINRHGIPLNFLLYWPHLPAGAELSRDTAGHFLLDVRDVPPAPAADWTPPADSSLYRVRFYYRSDSDASGFWAKETKRWSKEVDQLAEPTPAIRTAVAGLINKDDADLEKARKLYQAVQALDNIDFSKKKGNVNVSVQTNGMAQRPEDTWTRKSGSSEDITILYLSMLRAAGLTAYDMKVVNRDHSSFAPDYLYFDQLDDDLVVLSIKGKETVLDPGEKMCPFETVHWKHSGAGGVREGSAKPTQISPLQTLTANTLVRIGDIYVDEHGAATGNFRFTMTGQEALYWRQQALVNDEAEVKKEFDRRLATAVPEGVSAHIDRFESITNPDANLVAIVNIKGSLGAASAKGMQLPCFFFETRGHEPFAEEAKRADLVDMHYGEQVTDQVTYHVPAGMRVDGTPADARDSWEGHAVFAIKAKMDAGQVTIARSLARAFTFAKPDEYSRLHEFYEKVDAADRDQIVVSQAAASASVN